MDKMRSIALDKHILFHKVEFYKHNLNDQDKQALLEMLDSTFLTTGKLVADFEKKFAQYLSLDYAVGVSSCTHALELCLRYFKIGPGDEVITTPLSFVATANAIEYVGAKPVFVDVEESTGNINHELLEAAITQKTKAIIPVHLYGQMCDMRAVKVIADKYNLKVIEDAAHCIEGQRDGYGVGQLADAVCFSFYATKNITSGEGGAVATHNRDMYEWLLRGRSHGLSSNAADRYAKKYQHYDMEFLGMKCNMTNMQAALLINQLERIEELHIQRKKIVDSYDQCLSDFTTPLKVGKHAYHLYTIWHKKRDILLAFLQEHMIGAAVHYRPIHLMSFYKDKYGYQSGDFPHAERIGSKTISLPLYPMLQHYELEAVISTLQMFKRLHDV